MKLKLFFSLALLMAAQFITAQTPIKVSAPPGTEAYFPLVTAVYAEMGFKAEITVVPAERAFTDTNSGIYDAQIGAATSLLAAYPNLIATKEPLLEMYIQAWVKKGSPIAIASLEDLKKYKIGSMRGAKATENLITSLKLDAQTTLTDTPESLAKMLDGARFEVGLIVSAVAAPLLASTCTVANPKLVSVLTFHVYNKKNAALVPKFDATIKAMKADGRYQKLVSAK